MFVLDTDALTAALHDNRLVLDRIEARRLEDIWISIVAVEEVMGGAANAVNTARTRKRDVRVAYSFLHKTFSFLKTYQVLPYTDASHHIFSGFPKAIAERHPNDCRLAAIALEHDFVVVSRNVRHFKDLVTVENWIE